jgi:hypothetical protein
MIGHSSLVARFAELLISGIIAPAEPCGQPLSGRCQLPHVLSGGFVRIRHFGFLANRGHTAKLARCRALLAAAPPPGPAGPEPVAALMLRVTGVDIGQCPVCRVGHLRFLAVLRPGQIPALDTS